jgi:hypothetical protein
MYSLGDPLGAGAEGLGAAVAAGARGGGVRGWGGHRGLVHDGRPAAGPEFPGGAAASRAPASEKRRGVRGRRRCCAPLKRPSMHARVHQRARGWPLTLLRHSNAGVADHHRQQEPRRERAPRHGCWLLRRGVSKMQGRRQRVRAGQGNDVRHGAGALPPAAHGCLFWVTCGPSGKVWPSPCTAVRTSFAVMRLLWVIVLRTAGFGAYRGVAEMR